MRQVIENVESTKRQYALRGRATALGWRDDQIIVIDNDQGESGASASWREGFQRLVSDVSMGRAGIVMGLEVSRLARNNADWHRLLEICALADTLILDEDGVYDPGQLQRPSCCLALKGTMSEAELHVIKARLRGGILNKVRRGEYRCPLPTGFVYDEAGDVALDPDTQVRETIAHFFETFSRVGSASQTVKAFRKEGLLLSLAPPQSAATVFRPLTPSTAMRVAEQSSLRRRLRLWPTAVPAGGRGKKTASRTASAAIGWLAFPNAHPGYISWERYQVEPQASQVQWPWLRRGARVASSRRLCACCKDALSAADAAASFESAMPLDVADSNPGMSAIARIVTAASLICQSIAGPLRSTKPSACLLPSRSLLPPSNSLSKFRKEIEARYDEADQLAAAPSSAPRSKPISLSVASCSSTPTIASSPTLSKRDGTTSSALWPTLAMSGARPCSTINSSSTTLSASGSRHDSRTSERSGQIPTRQNRERKRLLAFIIEDVTLVKLPPKEPPSFHVRFKGGITLDSLLPSIPISSA